jgi:hypothetical protein
MDVLYFKATRFGRVLIYYPEVLQLMLFSECRLDPDLVRKLTVDLELGPTEIRLFMTDPQTTLLFLVILLVVMKRARYRVEKLYISQRLYAIAEIQHVLRYNTALFQTLIVVDKEAHVEELELVDPLYTPSATCGYHPLVGTSYFVTGMVDNVVDFIVNLSVTTATKAEAGPVRFAVHAGNNLLALGVMIYLTYFTTSSIHLVLYGVGEFEDYEYMVLHSLRDRIVGLYLIEVNLTNILARVMRSFRALHVFYAEKCACSIEFPRVLRDVHRVILLDMPSEIIQEDVCEKYEWLACPKELALHIHVTTELLPMYYKRLQPLYALGKKRFVSIDFSPGHMKHHQQMLLSPWFIAS